MLKRGSIGWAIWNIVESLLILTAGILALVFCESTDAYAVALITVGSIIVADAGLRLILDVIQAFIAPDAALVRANYGEAGASAMELALGIAFILGGVAFQGNVNGRADILAIFNFAALFASLVLIILGSIIFIYGLVYLCKKAGVVNSIVVMLGGAILITLGALMIVYVWNSDELMKFIFIFAGIVLLIVGVFALLGTILTLLGKGKKEGAAVVEAEVAVETPVASEEASVEVPGAEKSK
jgi:hypothetical protein